MDFPNLWPTLRGTVVLAVLLLLVSTIPLAAGEDSQKPKDWEKRLEMLRSVPYLALSQSEIDGGETGVQLYNPQKAYPGYNLYCTWSSGAAYLLDMEGREVHRWTYGPKRSEIHRHDKIDHAVLLENGDLVAVQSKEGVVLVDWASERIWKRELPAHHDVAQGEDGTFYVLIEELKDHRGLQVGFDTVVHLTADGDEIDRWSSYDHLEEIKAALDTGSFLDTVLDEALESYHGRNTGINRLKDIVANRYRYDYFHINAITVLPNTPLGETDSRFREGNLLVCLRNVDQIAVLEKNTYRLLWAWGEDLLQWPHHPTMLKNGHILIFDNGIRRRYSSVVELNPISREVVWQYMAESPRDFYSFTRGSAQRLPNGNVLICESDKGRVFEVTREGEVVWRWQNPIMVGRRTETLYRMTRLPLAQVDGLLGD